MSSTYLNARDPAAVAPVSETRTMSVELALAPRRGAMIRRIGAGGGGAGAGAVAGGLATDAPFAWDCDGEDGD